jgi:hypothetical protein
MDESLVMELWDTFREYIPDKNKEMAASQYVDFLLGKDIDAGTLESFLGYDSYLDTAIQNVLDEEKEFEEEENEDYYDEDEDY